MSFQKMMVDKIKILKTSGHEIDNIKASVQKDGIYTMRSDILIEPNDLIQRSMKNGGFETFLVIDPGFHERFRSIPANYQMKVRKLGLPEANAAIQKVTYNISGNNARINNDSIDNSTNSVYQNTEILDKIDELRKEIQKMISDEELRIEANEIVDAIEDQFKNSKPKKSVIKTLIAGLPKIASIASIGSFILSFLN